MLDFLFRPIRFQSLVLPHQSNLPSTFRTSSTGTHNVNYICNAIVSPTNRFLINLIRSRTHPIFFFNLIFRNPSHVSIVQLSLHVFFPFYSLCATTSRRPPLPFRIHFSQVHHHERPKSQNVSERPVIWPPQPLILALPLARQPEINPASKMIGKREWRKITDMDVGVQLLDI